MLNSLWHSRLLNLLQLLVGHSRWLMQLGVLGERCSQAGSATLGGCWWGRWGAGVATPGSPVPASAHHPSSLLVESVKTSVGKQGGHRQVIVRSQSDSTTAAS